jgi:hypothetical protein
MTELSNGITSWRIVCFWRRNRRLEWAHCKKFQMFVTEGASSERYIVKQGLAWVPIGDNIGSVLFGQRSWHNLRVTRTCSDISLPPLPLLSISFIHSIFILFLTMKNPQSHSRLNHSPASLFVLSTQSTGVIAAVSVGLAAAARPYGAKMSGGGLLLSLGALQCCWLGANLVRRKKKKE